MPHTAKIVGKRWKVQRRLRGALQIPAGDGRKILSYFTVKVEYLNS